ncbi:hypothetical protein E4U53_003318, partial [Claviceps sorghi]
IRAICRHHRPPVRDTCFAPNPWKARLALNFKALPHQTTWVPLPDIPRLRSQTLGMPPARFFADGTPYHTLPILHDPNASSPTDDARPGLLLGDSFDIAAHLETRYPLAGAGSLFPPQDLDLRPPHPDADADADPHLLIPLSAVKTHHVPYARFNNRVDALFSTHVPLMAYHMPLPPETAALSQAEFARRAGLPSWESFKLVGEPRAAMLRSLADALGPLAELLRRDATGPFVLGQRPSYADLIVGAWLRMMQRTLPGGEWREVAAWHAGVFGRLHDALGAFAEVR